MTTISYRHQAMTITKLALIATATVAATIGLAGIAHADDEIDFRSPSGNIVCAMGTGAVVCQVSNHTYPQPPLPDCPLGGREYELFQGAPASLGCQGGVVVDPPPPTLDYGQTGVTCTDSSTGHFLRLSRDSYRLG